MRTYLSMPSSYLDRGSCLLCSNLVHSYHLPLIAEDHHQFLSKIACEEGRISHGCRACYIVPAEAEKYAGQGIITSALHIDMSAILQGGAVEERSSQQGCHLPAQHGAEGCHGRLDRRCCLVQARSGRFQCCCCAPEASVRSDMHAVHLPVRYTCLVAKQICHLSAGPGMTRGITHVHHL